MNTLNIKPIIKKCGKRWLKFDFYASSPVSSYLNYGELWDYLRNGFDIKFNKPNKSNKIKYFDETVVYISILKCVQNESLEPKLSVNFLNRIIKNGGFIEYIKKLEQENLCQI